MPPSSTDARVLSVNRARLRPDPADPTAVTGIDKRPTGEPVQVRAPGGKADGLGSGLVGDAIGHRADHGGNDQAVYVYAHEDLVRWGAVLGRALPPGSFGENLTTEGIDVNGALIGERWRIGDEVELQVTEPRIPCSTFRAWIGEPGWLKAFTEAAVPGAYLRVIASGSISTGDGIRLVHRPDHEVTVSIVFRALTREPALLPAILAAADLPLGTRAMAEGGRTFSIPGS